MRKLFLLITLLLTLSLQAQVSNTKTVRIDDATTALGKNISIGTQVYNVATGELWIANAAVINTATLTTASGSFDLVGGDVTKASDNDGYTETGSQSGDDLVIEIGSQSGSFNPKLVLDETATFSGQASLSVGSANVTVYGNAPLVYVDAANGLSVEGNKLALKDGLWWGQFQGNNLTADRIYQLPDAPGTFALEANPSGFDGNLAVTDNTLQEIAQKVDDLVITDTNLSIATVGEINTGTDNTKAISALGLKGSDLQKNVDSLKVGTKNAKAFGFLPTNNGEDNVTALQAAIDANNGGGTIVVDYPGTYDINASIVLPSNTHLEFGKDVFIKKVSYNGSSPRFTFVNAGAWTKTYDENITIKGLNLITNAIGVGTDATDDIVGGHGHIFFFYVKNLSILDYTCLDIDVGAFGVQVCTFENLRIINTHLEGDKDGIHLGKGNGFLIDTYLVDVEDDAIALNGHDWVTSNPQAGWIENGVIRNVVEKGTYVTGFFSRLLTGAWDDWSSSMSIHRGDIVVASNNKLYRSTNAVGATLYTSTTEPSHASGNVTHESIEWEMIQDDVVEYTAGVRNVTFKNIKLEKDRPTAFSFQLSDSDYSRSFYPNADIPQQGNINFENITVTGDVTNLVTVNGPVTDFKVINSSIVAQKILMTDMAQTGLTYPDTDVLLSGNTYKGAGAVTLVSSPWNVNLKVLGSIVVDSGYTPTFSTAVNVINSDLPGSVLNVQKASTGYTWTPGTRTTAIFEGTASNSSVVSIVGKAAGQSSIWFGDENSESAGRSRYDHTIDEYSIWTAGVSRFKIGSTGNFGIGTTGDAEARLHVQKGSTAYTWTPNAITNTIFEGTTSNQSQISIIGKAAGSSNIWFGDEDSESRGRIRYDHTIDGFGLWTASGERVTIASNGDTTINGDVTADVFIKSGATADDVLLGNGTTTSLAAIDDDDGVTETYGVGWDADTTAPTKNDVYDKIETINGGSVIANSNILANDYANRVMVNGGVIESLDQLYFDLNNITTESFQFTPNSTAVDTLYAIQTSDYKSGNKADFDFARTLTATRVNVNGINETVAADTPRIDYSKNPSGELLIEPSRENLSIRSEEFDNAAWNNIRSSETADQAYAPDGTLTADKLIEDATASNTHYLRKTSNITGTVNFYTFSAFVKAAERNYVFINLQSGGNYAEARFNLSDGTTDLTNTTGLGASWDSRASSIEDYGNGWYKCTVIGEHNNTSSIQPQFLVSDGNRTYTGDGVSGIYIWGADVQIGEFPTSYIPTVASTVTRNAPTIDGAGDTTIIDSEEGVIYIEAAALFNGTNARYVSASDGTAANQVYVGYDGGTNRIEASYCESSICPKLNYTVTDVTAISKIAFRWAQDDMALWIDGVEVATNTNSDVAAANTLNEIKLSYGDDTLPFEARIREIKFFKGNQTDTFLGNLTSKTDYAPKHLARVDQDPYFTQDVTVQGDVYANSVNGVYDIEPITLNTTQIKALNSAPVTLIPAQGADTIVILKEIIYEFSFLTTAYTTNTTLDTYYNGESGFLTSTDNVLDATADIIYGVTGAGTKQYYKNTAIKLKEPTGNPAAGSGTMTIHAKYELKRL